MISRYLEYTNPKFKKEVLSAGSNTIIVFSRLNDIICLNGEKIKKLNRIFDLLQEKAEEEENDEKENLYGSFVDAFGEENYLANHQTETNERELKVMELATMPLEDNTLYEKVLSNETLVAFGYLNSKDFYLNPDDLNLLLTDLKWFVYDSGRCKNETATFVKDLMNKIENEIQQINENIPHANLFVCGL